MKDFEFTASGYSDVLIASIRREDWLARVAGCNSVSDAFRSLTAEGEVTTSSLEIMNYDRFKSLVCEILELTDVERHTRLADAGADSLQLLELLVAIETATDTKIRETDLATGITLQSLWELYTIQASSPRLNQG